jgi:AbrB family transcriptional regulator, transcriptional pleiotropic regulator of transition state genes
MAMKATGVVRKVDELGRVVIPIELRRNLGIAEKDGLEIFVDDEKIILKRYAPACIFCDSADNITSYKGRNICSGCLTNLRSIE